MGIGKPFEPDHLAAEKHGIFTFENRGPDTLSPHRVTHLAELRQLVATHPGRMEVRQELTARCALIVAIGFSELEKAASENKSIWDVPVSKRLGSYMAELRRLLESFPPDNDGPLDVTEMLRGPNAAD